MVRKFTDSREREKEREHGRQKERDRAWKIEREHGRQIKREIAWKTQTETHKVYHFCDIAYLHISQYNHCQRIIKTPKIVLHTILFSYQGFLVTGYIKILL